MAKEPLRRGWTTGACATAATRAAYTALLTGEFPDPVTISLPRGRQSSFALATEELGNTFARAGIIKDAGDDPDVTHGAMVIATVRLGPLGQGVRFLAGEGVGIVTKPGLPLPVGEPAINPVPRQLMNETIRELAAAFRGSGDVDIEISIPGGAKLAERTWNPRLGIQGGLSVLGTTGVVIPYSCSAWIHSIHRGIDVARATGLTHVAGCTGTNSESAVQALYALPDQAMLDMGDFAGGLLKYLRTHPVPQLTIGGGFAKISKLAMGHLDLHSGRSRVDMDWLAGLVGELGGELTLIEKTVHANTAAEVLGYCQTAEIPLGNEIAARARSHSLTTLRGAGAIEVIVFARDGSIVGRAGFESSTVRSPSR